MLNKNVKLAICISAIAATIFSCKKSETTPATEKTLPAAEATSTLATSDTEYKADSSDFAVATSVSGTTLSSLSSYGGTAYNISLPTGKKGTETTDDLINFVTTLGKLSEVKTSSVFGARIPKGFSDAEGVWAYSYYKRDFVRVSTGGGKIVLKFPSKYVYYPISSVDSINDAEYSISQYETSPVKRAYYKCYGQGSDKYDTIPTKFSAELKVSNVSVMSVAYSATYDADGNTASLDGTFTYGDFAYYYKSTNTANLLSYDWGRKKSGKVFRGLSLSIVYEDGKGFECNATSNYAKSFSYSHIVADIKFTISVDESYLKSQQNATITDTVAVLNKIVSYSLSKNSTSEKIGDVIIKKNTGSKLPIVKLSGYGAFIKFADGTEKELEDAASFIKNIVGEDYEN